MLDRLGPGIKFLQPVFVEDCDFLFGMATQGKERRN
jgi:hypothetical protein